MAFGNESVTAVERGPRARRSRRQLISLLFASTLLSASLFVTSVLHAQQPSAQAQERTVSFSIPAQPLPSAINAFIRATGWQVGYSSRIADGITSRLVSGSMPPARALETLLAGTGISVRFNGPTTATLVVGEASGGTGASIPGAINLDTINVQGDDQSPYGPGVGYTATRSVAGTKTDTPIIETPQSISVVTRQQIDDQAPEEVNQALRYTTGIVPESFGVASNFNNGNNFIVRGFPVDSYVDDLKDPLLGVIPPYLINRVEVIGGPASVLYGQASPGGLVNISSKLPTETPIHEVELGTGNYGRIEGAFDIGGPLDKDGQYLYRLTGTGFSEDTQTDFIKRQTIAIAPSFTWRPDGDTTLTILGKYINNPALGALDAVPAQGTVLPNPHGTIPSSFDTGDPNFSTNKQTIASVGYMFQHRFNDGFAIRQNFRYTNSDSVFGYIFNSGLEPDLMTLDRGSLLNQATANAIAVDTQAEAKFATGFLSHKVLLGIDYQWVSTNSTYAFDFSDIPTINVFAPIYYQSIPADILADTDHTSEVQQQIAPYAQDQMSLGNWRFVIGGREDFANTNSLFTPTTGPSTPTTQSDRAFTWRTGVVYLFDNGVAPYASYSTSFEPQIGTLFSGSPYAPTTGQQYEAGVKYQPPGSNSFITGAVYNLTEQNVLTPDPDPTHSGFDIQTGEIRARGIELQAHASLTDNLSLIATYTFTDAINTQSNTTDTTIDGVTESTQGKHPVGIPEQMASTWGDYTIPSGVFRGLGFGGGIRYIGPSYGDDVNSFTVPGVVLFDAALHYDLGSAAPSLKGLKLQVNAANLFDKTYISSCIAESGCYFGFRRTVYATLKYTW